jgi:hypothetical protein
VDESTDARITEALKEAGYKIFSIQEMMLLDANQQYKKRNRWYMKINRL